METKDWLYVAGLLLTFGVSVASLLVNIKNRKNAIREHLYKEQFAFFIGLSDHLGKLIYEFENVLSESELSDTKDSEIGKMIANIELYTDQNITIVPNEIYDLLFKAENEARNLYSLIYRKKGDIDGEDIEPFYKVYDDLLEVMREFMGVDELSNENRKLISRMKE